MTLEFFLPGAVLLLKSVFRVVIDREVTWIPVAKAIFFIPTDLVFLSFSYLVAISLTVEDSASDTQRTKVLIGILFVYTAASAIMSVICSKTDKMAERVEMKKALYVGLASYILAIFIVLFTIFVIGDYVSR